MDKFYKSVKQILFLTRMQNGQTQTQTQTENQTQTGLIDMEKIKMLQDVLKDVNTAADQLRTELRSGVVPIGFDTLISVDVDFEPKRVDAYVSREAFGEEEIYITGVRIRDAKITFYMHKDPEMDDDPFIYRMDTRVTIEMWELILLNMVIDNIIDALKKEKAEFRERTAQIRATGLTD